MPKKFFFKIALIGSISVACLGAGELAVRIFNPAQIGPVMYNYDPQLGAVHFPNQRGRRIHPSIYDFTYSNNSYGLRGAREYSFGKSEKFRILLLGDSMAYGLGVNDDQIFAYKIEKRLSNENQSVEIINAGSVAKGTDYALKFFKTLGYKFKSDLVILFFYPNDFDDNKYSLYYGIGEKENLSVKLLSHTIAKRKQILNHFPIYRWLIAKSHFMNFLKWTVIRLTSKYEKAKKGILPETGTRHTGRKYDSLDSDTKKITDIFVKHLKKSVRDSGSNLIIFYTPSYRNVEHYRKAGRFSKKETAIRDIAKIQNIEFLSLTPILCNSKKTIDQLYLVDYPERHWTPLAHSIIAQFISQSIDKYVE